MINGSHGMFNEAAADCAPQIAEFGSLYIAAITDVPSSFHKVMMN